MDELTINGLVEIQSDDIYANYVTVYNDLTVYGNQIFNGNQIVDGNLTVSGNSLLNNVVVEQGATFNSSLYVSGDTNLNNLNVSGILNLTNLTIGGNATFDNNVHIGGDLTVSGLFQLNNLNLAGNLNVSGSSNFASPLTINRDSANVRSELVLNYGSSITATRVGVFYNQMGTTFQKIPLISTDALGESLLFSVPNNIYSQIRISPELTGTLNNYVIIQRPNTSTQQIESNLSISGNLELTGNINNIGNITVTGNIACSSINTNELLISGNDFRTLFSVSGGLLTYNGLGEFSLTEGAIRTCYTAGSGIVISSTGVISNNDASKWSITANTIYPKDNYNINQLVIGLTGEGNTSSLAHFKGSTRTNMMIESSNIASSPQITLKNAGGGNGYIKSILNRIDLDVGNNNALSVLDGKVGINQINPSYELEVANTLGDTNTVITSYNSNSNGYAGVFLKNDTGVGGVLFQNGSAGGENGANAFNIRNDLNAGTIIENKNTFKDDGSNLNLVGEPTINSFIWGGGHNVYNKKLIYDPDSQLYHLYGDYASNTFIIVPNLDGTNSAYTLPSSSNIKNLFLITYQSDGSVYSVWYFATNRDCNAKNLVIDDNPSGWIWICGQYANNGTSTIIPNLYSGTSLLTLPSTGAGAYTGFLLGFKRNTGDCEFAWNTNNVNHGTIYDSVNDLIVLPSSRIIIVGTISPNAVYNIPHLNQSASAYNWTTSAGQCAFALRFNPKLFNSLTGYHQWTLDNSFYYSIAYNKNQGNTECIISGVYYNTAGARTLINFGNGASAYGINIGTTGNTLVIRFTGIESDTINNMTVNGRWECNNNISITRIQESIIRFNQVTNRYVYASMYFSGVPVTIYNDLASRVVYGVPLRCPINSVNYGTYIIEFQNNANGYVNYLPSMFYGTTTSDELYDLKFDSSGNTYVLGYMKNTGSTIRPTYIGMYGVPIGYQIPTGTSLAFCHVYDTALKTIGFLSTQNISNATHYRDICFIPSSNDFYMIGYTQSTSSVYMGNFENYGTGFTIPSSIGFNSALHSRYTKQIATSNYFNNSGVGIGRANNGTAQLEVEHGFYTPSQIICNRYKTTTDEAPIFSDYYGREMGQLVKVSCNFDALSATNIVIKQSMNVYGITRYASGYYTLYYMRDCPYGNNYTALVSSCGYLGNNYTIFPFISTSNSVIGAPLYKTSNQIVISTNQTGGAGYDVREMNYIACW